MSRALVAMAAQGVEAEVAAREKLAEAYSEFMDAGPAIKVQAGKELIQAVFGKNAIAEDPLC